MNGEFDKDFIDTVNKLEDEKDYEWLIKIYSQYEDPACKLYISEAIAFAMDKTEWEVEQILRDSILK